MKKYYKIAIILLGLLFIKVVLNYTLNQIIIEDSKKDKYDKSLIKILESTTILEKYVPYYNEGNIYYKQKKYEKAIDQYNKALTKKPPIAKKCDIRVNLSIALVQNINSKNKDEILKELQEARENLYNDHCADPEDNSGESSEAEALEEAIKDMEEELQKNSGDGEEGGDKEEEHDGDGEEQNLEKQLQEINKDANASRQSQMEDYKNLGDYHYYSGKSW